MISMKIVFFLDFPCNTIFLSIYCDFTFFFLFFLYFLLFGKMKYERINFCHGHLDKYLALVIKKTKESKVYGKLICVFS